MFEVLRSAKRVVSPPQKWSGYPGVFANGFGLTVPIRVERRRLAGAVVNVYTI